MPLTISAGLVDEMVLQRDAQDRANVTVRGAAPPEASGAVVVTVRRQRFPLEGWEEKAVGQAERGAWTATLSGLPVGGPYTITFALAGQPESGVTTRGVLVGDLWVLAGQSNMEGVGDLADVESPSPFVHLFDMADRWQVAEEPLHWLCDSPDSCHCEVTGAEQKRLQQETRQTRTKGAGLGLPFAKALVEATGVPIGLLACAHGGTSMQQWNPELKGLGGGSLYGSMLGRVQRAGGKVRGVLWYQGESDANPNDVPLFHARFKALVANVREDFGNPNLPFYTVQIGRFVFLPAPGEEWTDPASWNGIQEQQRRLAAEIPYSGVAPAVDLELDDLIHIGTQGLKRLGRRLARIARHGLRGESGPPPGPRLSSITKEGLQLRVRFEGVAAAGFLPSLRVTGFSLHDENGKFLPYIYKATVDPARPTDILLWLIGPVGQNWSLQYGYGFDPACTLTDAEDMAVPVFGPVPL